MNNILTKLLQRKGIGGVDQLSTEEKNTFVNWNRVLSKEKLSIDDFREFITSRIGEIENRWQDKNTDNAKKAELIPYHTVYKTMLNAINAPQVEREALERTLLAQIQ